MEAPGKIKTKHNILLIAGILIMSICLLCACNMVSKKELDLRKEGIEYVNNHDYAKAIETFDKALEFSDAEKLSETDIDILRYRAQAEWMLEDFDAAANTYDMLIKYDGSRQEDINFYIISSVKGSGDLDNAIKLYEQSNDADDSIGREESILVLGWALTNADVQEDKKQAYIDTALNMYNASLQNPKLVSCELYNRIGLIYYNDEDYEKALDEFTQGISWADQNDNNKEGNTENMQDDDSYKALKYNEASCYEYMHEYDKALTLFKEYEDTYGPEEKSTHEIEFLETR